MIRPLSCIAATAVVLLASLPVRAETPNEITAVSYSEDPASATTRIRVRGARTPTFTVYKLDKPSRVVIDVPRARLSDALRGHDSASVFTASTWAVTTIAAQQLDDGGQIVRVIVTMARPGRYDVKTENNEVVVALTARDPAPPKIDSEALVKAQAEADRLRKIAADQAARADAAQKAADEAKRQGKLANAAELDKANAEAAKAKDLAAKAQGEAERMRIAAERAKQIAQAEAAKAKLDADAARTDAAKAKADASRAKQETDVARNDATRAKQDADAAKAFASRAKQETDAARNDATRAKQDADAARNDATRAKLDADRAKQETDAARADANRAKEIAKRQAEETERARLAAEAAKQAAIKEAAAIKAQAAREAAAAKAEADAAKRDAERVKAEAAAAKLAAEKQIDAASKVNADVEKARREADAARALAAKMKADADAARQDAVAARTEASRTKNDADAAQRTADAAQRAADAARRDAQTAKGEATAAKAEVAKARAEADAAKADAERAKQVAAQDRQNAERARTEADKLARDAKAQLAILEKKTQTAQALEDKARAANAAAEARDQAAKDDLIKAKKEREAAEAAAKLAVQRATDARTADRQKAEAEAKQAEERLAKARKATEEAEGRRLAAEAAALGAKKQLDQTRDSLAIVERQRGEAEVAASTATRKRGEAEAAATDATRRRAEAEVAATDAAKRRREAEALRNDAEAQRKAAEEAARVAKLSADAAEQQRVVAEKSLRDAQAAKSKAEKSLDELTTRRLAAEHAASELEKRSKEEARKQVEIAAATARKATDAEVARMRTEAAKLADERKRAEAELADRRKAVAAQQQLATQLEATAVAARDAAKREETRKNQLAQQRIAEETALAKLKGDRDAAAKLAAQEAKQRADAAKVAKVEPKPVVKAGPKAKVSDIAFKGGEGNGDVAIAFSGDAKVSLGEIGASHVELFIDNAELAAKLERKLDVTRYGSPVKAISSFRDRKNPDRIRLIAELSQPATPTLERNATGASLKFHADVVAKRAPRTQAVPPQVVGGFGATSTPLTPQSVTQVPPQGTRRRVYRGATVDFDFKDAPIHDLLRIIADTGRVNIVVPDNINAKVTVRLKRVPWDQALEVILSSHGLWYRREGNLFRVADRKELDKEDKEAAERAEAARKAETPRPQVVRLNYADAKELAPKLKGMVSPNGTLEVDERQNALIINDVAGNRNEIERLALGLDTQTPQISIEARIVEARSTFVRQIGVQWGGRALATAQGGNTTGLIFPSSVALVGGNEDAQTVRQGVAAPSDFAVNLPAATGSGEGGAIGLSLGSIGGNFALNLRLSALEDSGTVRIISAPKITVLNNKPAKITQGVSIPIQVISAQGTQTQLVQADLSLEVTPYVSSRDCAVQMKLVVTKNEPDFVNVGARGDPSFLRKEASTTMLIQDGDTSVLGGIYTRNSGLAFRKIPFFGDLPVLGWFFKNRRENDDRTEILVFITPKITNKAQLSCQ
jgi:type IV pilus assembly protein PilQ